MSNVTITVAETQPVQRGKKQASVFDTTGKKWGVWPDKLHYYIPGQSYILTKVKSYEFNGKTYFTIEEAVPYEGQEIPAAPIRQAPVAPRPQMIPQPIRPPSIVSVSTPKDEMIFVCGIVNNAVGNPNVAIETITSDWLINLIGQARHAWRNTLGKSQVNAEMDDEIPL